MMITNKHLTNTNKKVLCSFFSSFIFTSMRTYINYQSKEDLKESYVNNSNEFENWTSANLNTVGHKLYLIMTGPDQMQNTPKEWFVTSSILDIELWFENVNMYDKVFIQEFECGDYKELLGYLGDLYEINDHFHPLPLSVN
jgi:hypothetical protein